MLKKVVGTVLLGAVAAFLIGCTVYAVGLTEAIKAWSLAAALAAALVVGIHLLMD